MTSILPSFRWQDLDFTKPSVWSLILANLVPLVGVLFFGWSTFGIVLVYWSENLMLGVINILKMLASAPTPSSLKEGLAPKESQEPSEIALQEFVKKHSRGAAFGHHLSKLFFVPFFTVHYGMFCLVHGVFVIVLLGQNGLPDGDPFEMVPEIFRRLKDEGLLWAMVALAASHLFSFFYNYLWQGEFRRATVPTLMFQPYGRIVVLHLAIIGGAFLIMSLGSPIWLLLLLIAGKTLLDIGLHLAEHNPSSADSQPDPVTT